MSILIHTNGRPLSIATAVLGLLMIPTLGSSVDYRERVVDWARIAQVEDDLVRFDVDWIEGRSGRVTSIFTRRAMYVLNSRGTMTGFRNYGRFDANHRQVPIAPDNPLTTDEAVISRTRAILRASGLPTEWDAVKVEDPTQRGPDPNGTGRGRSDAHSREVIFEDLVGPYNDVLNSARVGVDLRDGAATSVQSWTGESYDPPERVMSRAEAAVVIRRLYERKGWRWPGDAVVASRLTLSVSSGIGSMRTPLDHPGNLQFGDGYSAMLWRERRARLAYTFLDGRYGAVIDAENGRPIMEAGSKSGGEPPAQASNETKAGADPRPPSAPAALWIGLGSALAVIGGASWLARRGKPTR